MNKHAIKYGDDFVYLTDEQKERYDNAHRSPVFPALLESIKQTNKRYVRLKMDIDKNLVDGVYRLRAVNIIDGVSDVKRCKECGKIITDEES